MKYQYLFWDLDGTLTDPGIGITNSIIYSLNKFGIEVEDRSTLYKFIGPRLVESYKKYYDFDDEKALLAVKYYREYFGEKGLFENELYPFIPEFLCKCKEAGFKICLATSKPENFTFRIMEHFDLAKYFDYMCGSTTGSTHETKADVIRKALALSGAQNSDVVMIGDRMHDIIGAAECGIDSIAVKWGYGDTEEFETYNAKYIVDDIFELEKIIF